MAPDTLSGYLTRFEKKYSLPHIHAHKFRHSITNKESGFIMDRMIIDSKLIYSVGYFDGVLEVEFRDGGLFQYDDVPPEVFHELTVAKSVGGYFIKNIKPVYRCRKLR